MKIWILALICSAMLGGGLFWVFDSSSHFTRSITEESSVSSQKSGSILVSVGHDTIHRDEVDFERDFALYMQQKHLSTDGPMAMESVHRDISQFTQSGMQNLLEFILKNIIHRKILLAMVKRDKHFDLTNVEIYRQCRAEYVQTLKENHGFFEEYDHYKKIIEYRLCETYIVDFYTQSMIFRNISVTEDDLQQYYNKYKQDFVVDKRIVTRHIQLSNERDARKVRYKLTSRNFARLAQKHSIAPEATEGGLLGPFAAHEMPALFSDVFRLKTQRVSPVVKSSYGYHIFLPLKVYPEVQQSFEDVREELEERVLQMKKNQLYLRWFHLALNSITVKTESYDSYLQESVNHFHMQKDPAMLSTSSSSMDQSSEYLQPIK